MKWNGLCGWNRAACNAVLVVNALVWALQGWGVAFAQEPAYLAYTMAARYEEAPGYFHYVSPCAIPVGKEKLPAVCWPVLLGKIEMADGKAKFSTPVTGLMMVSASLVRFVPDDAKSSSLMADRKPEEIEAKYNAKQVFELVHTPEGYYGMGFRAFCFGCATGTSPIDTTKVVQLSAEYSEFEDSLKHFDAVSKRVQEIASKARVSVTPKNQPGLDDVAEAMGLYSEVNKRLAGVCAEPARSCVKQYASYQACKSGSLNAECGAAPSCSAACGVSAAELQSLKAFPCTSKGGDSMSLGPDWTPVALKMDAAREARKNAEATKGGPKPIDPSQIKTAPDMAGKRLDFMGRPVDDSNPCSVEFGYAMAMMTHTVRSGVGTGMQVTPMGAPGGVSAPLPVVDPVTGAATVLGGVMAGRIASRVPPIYPALAKAAHISGTVVMKAVISKTGDVADLSVVSGPDMLRSSAVDAVRQWKYKPYLLDGQPIEVHTQIFVNFNFGDGARVPTVPGAVPAQP